MYMLSTWYIPLMIFTVDLVITNNIDIILLRFYKRAILRAKVATNDAIIITPNTASLTPTTRVHILGVDTQLP